MQHAIYASICWQEGAGRDEVCTCIPADVIVGVELVCDVRDSLAMSVSVVDRVEDSVGGLLS